MRFPTTILSLALGVASTSAALAQPVPSGPYQSTGFKTGEATDSSIRIWTRLTSRAAPNAASAPMVTFKFATPPTGKPKTDKRRRIESIVYPDGKTVADIRHAAPGARGQTRVRYRIASPPKSTADESTADGATADWSTVAWQDVDPKRDFTRQFLIEGLQPNSRYDVRVEGRASADAKTGSELAGSFRTAPAPDAAARVVFTVSTGQAFKDRDCPEGYKIYAKMRQLDPNFFVHTGDIVYYDTLAKTEALARYHWQRTYSLASNVDFHRHVSSYFIKDDHDTWQNDCWPTMKNGKDMFEFTFAQGLAIFPEQVPMGESTYRTRRWGKDLQVWFVEGRDFRSPNDAKDTGQKTIWGKTQLKWFKKSLRDSDATFRILISPTPIVGPDRGGKRDNHSNAVFAKEGKKVRKILSKEKNVAVICGDRHWQYMSIHPRHGVREFSCGPASDQHAGGWKPTDFRKDYHRYLQVIGGFLAVTVEPGDKEKDVKPSATFRFHDVAGKVRFEDRLVGE